MHRQLVVPLLIALGAGCAIVPRTLPATTPVGAPIASRAPLWQFELIPHGASDPSNASDDPLDAASDVASELNQAIGQAPAPAEPISAHRPDLTVLTTPPLSAVKSSGYGWRKDPFRRTRKFHSGADYPSNPGTPVAAAGDGVVVFAGRRSGYGNMVLVDHGSGVATLYGHLRKIEVHTDAKISAGERIGQVGQTGRATGPHLHFEVHVEGRPVDPVMAMAIAETERSSPDDNKLAALALTSTARAENRSRARSKPVKHLRRNHGKRPQTLW